MWTPAAVLAASDAWVWVPPGAERLTLGGVDLIDYPDWARMGFYVLPRHAGAQSEAVVDEVVRIARERGHAASSWWISPTAAPSLAQSLTRRGAEVSEVTEILAFDMSERLPDTGPTEGITTHVVADDVTLDEAETVLAAVWGGEPSAGERRERQLAELADLLDAEGQFRVVAYLGTRAVAVGGCHVVDGVARLYGGGCLPDARGLGAYRALVRARLEVARRHGATLALVHARVNTSAPILLRTGFDSYGQGLLYSLPNSLPTPPS